MTRKVKKDYKITKDVNYLICDEYIEIYNCKNVLIEKIYKNIKNKSGYYNVGEKREIFLDGKIVKKIKQCVHEKELLVIGKQVTDYFKNLIVFKEIYGYTNYFLQGCRKEKGYSHFVEVVEKITLRYNDGLVYQQEYKNCKLQVLDYKHYNNILLEHKNNKLIYSHNGEIIKEIPSETN